MDKTSRSDFTSLAYIYTKHIEKTYRIRDKVLQCCTQMDRKQWTRIKQVCKPYKI